jgi:hypothetical protein
MSESRARAAASGRRSATRRSSSRTMSSTQTTSRRRAPDASSGSGDPAPQEVGPHGRFLEETLPSVARASRAHAEASTLRTAATNATNYSLKEEKMAKQDTGVERRRFERRPAVTRVARSRRAAPPQARDSGAMQGSPAYPKGALRTCANCDKLGCPGWRGSLRKGFGFEATLRGVLLSGGARGCWLCRRNGRDARGRRHGRGLHECGAREGTGRVGKVHAFDGVCAEGVQSDAQAAKGPCGICPETTGDPQPPARRSRLHGADDADCDDHRADGQPMRAEPRSCWQPDEWNRAAAGRGRPWARDAERGHAFC